MDLVERTVPNVFLPIFVIYLPPWQLLDRQ